MTDRLVLSELDTPPLRIGEQFVTRHRTQAGERRAFVGFIVEANGRARWIGGPRPLPQTFAGMQKKLDRRFCPERRAS